MEAVFFDGRKETFFFDELFAANDLPVTPVNTLDTLPADEVFFGFEDTVELFADAFLTIDKGFSTGVFFALKLDNSEDFFVEAFTTASS